VRALRRASAFLRKGLRAQATYRASWILELASAAMLLGMYYFLAQLVDAGRPALLGEYAEGGYFGFVLTGVVLSTLLSLGVRNLADEVRQGQLTGTLESLFLTPLASWEVVLWSGLWGFVRGLAKLLMYVLLGLFFGLGLERANWLAATVSLVFALTSLVPLGILVAAYVVTVKRAEPLTLLLSAASTFLAGVYFPLSLLPEPLRWLASFFPLTHAVRALRGALLLGRSVFDLAPSLAALALFALSLIPLSLWVFDRAVIAAKARGDLAHY
jgi:ABC-2 type transport system permease protein